MIKGEHEWVKLPDRQPRGHPDNLERERLLATSDKARLTDGEWYVRVKKEEGIDKRRA